MGRRASVVGSIMKLSQSIGVYERKKERQNLINNYSGGPKEKAPTYSLSRVDFNENTRTCKITILQSQQYRTIKKYVQQNYQKYPIYSEWKTRTKNITKSIKLTNEELEHLNCNSDPYISLFAYEIVKELRNESLLPSWYLKDIVETDGKIKLDSIITAQNETKKFVDNTQTEINKNTERIKTNIKKYYKILVADKKELEKCKKIIKKINDSSKPSFLKIFTLGIYAWLVSKKRVAKLTYKSDFLESDIANYERLINDLNVILLKEKDNLSLANKTNNFVLKNYDYKYAVQKLETQKLLSQITPLTDIEED
ncbi:MAG: hypothetical protein SOY31_00140 [Bacilli bacterium]|nr:hypothetical protein [Bacilli bacterium]MDY4155398.1 hypothetical protein [Bacilli bacterium]